MIRLHWQILLAMSYRRNNKSNHMRCCLVVNIMNVTNSGLQNVINASGKMSILGVSTLSDEVVAAMKQGAQSFYVMDDLKNIAGEQIAKYMKTEAAMVTNSASAAIVLAISGL